MPRKVIGSVTNERRLYPKAHNNDLMMMMKMIMMMTMTMIWMIMMILLNVAPFVRVRLCKRVGIS